MKTGTARLTKRINFNSNALWIVIVLFAAVIAGIAVSDKKPIYFAAVLSPLIIYLCIHKPFIFPFGVYAFLLPCDNLLSVSGSDEGTTLTKLLGVLTILVFTLKGTIEHKFKKPDVVLIWWMLFIMYGALTVCWVIKPESFYGKLPTAVGMVLLYLVIANYNFEKKELETIKWCIFFGGIAAALYTIYLYNTGVLSGGGGRASLSVGERGADPNNLVFSLILPVSICIEKFLHRNNKMLIKSLCGIAVGVFIYCVIITGSRGGLLSLGTIVIVYILFLRQRLTFSIVLMVVGIVILSITPEFLIERFDVGKAAESGGAGRLDIWYAGWLAIKKYWVLGAGFGNFPSAYNEFAQYSPTFRGWDRAPHNMYIGTFVELGFIGMVLMGVALWKHYSAVKARFDHHNYEAIMLRASFWAMLISNLFLGLLWHKSFWLLFMMMIMHKNICDHKLKKQQ